MGVNTILSLIATIKSGSGGTVIIVGGVSSGGGGGDILATDGCDILDHKAGTGIGCGSVTTVSTLGSFSIVSVMISVSTVVI